ncbi:MAG TPA: EamA family transporter RarD [Asticcacaulis sp.]|nr:EamA family transporter RarD [Asticcacaulis sp.]
MSPATKSVSPVWLAATCYFIWGIVPLFYVPIHAFGAGAIEIIAHRSLWAAVWAGGAVFAAKQWPDVIGALRVPYVRWMLLLSSLLVAINWGVYVWSVTSGHTIDAALGYYLMPLLNMAAGAALFRERVDNWGKAAIGLAAVGVAIETFAIGHLPWIALAVAVSFGGYGIVRKHLPVNALAGLFIETAYLFLPALIYVSWYEMHGHGHFFRAPGNAVWLMLTGPVTVLPLVLFSYAAKRLPLSTLGFIQFIGPTLTFAIGLAQGEPFSVTSGVSFAFIWLGAAVFAFGAWRRLRVVKVAA